MIDSSGEKPLSANCYIEVCIVRQKLNVEVHFEFKVTWDLIVKFSQENNNGATKVRDVGTGGALGARAPPRFCKERKSALFTIGILPHFRKFKVFESALLAAKVPLKCRAPQVWNASYVPVFH